MERIESIEQIRQLVAQVKAKRKGFLTNFYLDEFKHSIWIGKGVLFLLRGDDTCFIIRKKELFWNVYFITTGLDDLEQGLNMLKGRTGDVELVFDVIGKKGQNDALLGLFSRCGFVLSTTFVRMNRIPSLDDNRVVSGTVTMATVSQIREIEELLYRFFEDRIEQIPYYEELSAYAASGHVLVCIENDKVIGFLIFEENPSTLYLRYWFVQPNSRDKKVGSDLMNVFLERGKDVKRQLFWVRMDNENAMVRYRHYGFKEENMYDYIMINKQ